MLTDVKLEVMNEIFPAHKIILAAASPYFRGNHIFIFKARDFKSQMFPFLAMFTSGLREKDASIVKLQGVCPTIMKRILSFIYTGEIVINQLIVCQLLPAANMLQASTLFIMLDFIRKLFSFLNGFLYKQVTPVIQACCTFLEHQLDPSNALGIAAFAEQHNCKNLMDAANKFVDQHFIQVRKQILVYAHYLVIYLIIKNVFRFVKRRNF